ncbi:MAG: cell division protein FtsB [Porticoccus sp.]|jgi:cell division protein FtsB|nr:cell division protein FtsB [Porticoccus sp.]|tara:strand:- start:476 stop:754 length:279 start_codon:yes stop_codon:yes gene_type:complete
MRWLLIILCVFISIFQYRLWIGDGSLSHKHKLQNDAISQQKKNENLRQKNLVLANELKNLTNSTDSVEERARRDLGMIKEGETFYMIVEKEN